MVCHNHFGQTLFVVLSCVTKRWSVPHKRVVDTGPIIFPPKLCLSGHPKSSQELEVRWLKKTRNNCFSKESIVLNAATDPLLSCCEEVVLFSTFGWRRHMFVNFVHYILVVAILHNHPCFHINGGYLFWLQQFGPIREFSGS